MARELVECNHPDLPDVTVRLVTPWGGWRPVKKKTSRPVVAETDSPATGVTTTDKE